MKKITINNIAQAVSGEIIHEEMWSDKRITGVVIDSRAVEANMLFVPILGEQVDGHAFIGQAYSSGAALVFTEDATLILEGQVAILVKNTRKALGDLAKYYRQLLEVKVIGVTGSVGKTSTKELLASICSQRYRVHKTKGNLNNDLGVPLTLLGLEVEHEVAIIEMGMDRLGEIHYLSDLARPDLAVITNIGVSHIEHLGSRENILKAKSEIIDFLDPKGTLYLWGDDPYLKTLIGKIQQQTMTYGYEAHNDCRILGIKQLDAGKQNIDFSTRKCTYHVEVDFVGEHILLNSLAGALIGEKLGLTRDEIVAGIKSYKSEKMRLTLTQLSSGGVVIDDAYNASVDSMKSAIKTLNQLAKNKHGKTVAILGSMFELGDYEISGHEEVGQYLVEYKIDRAIVIGKEAQHIFAGAIKSGFLKGHIVYFENQEDFLANWQTYIDETDHILVKGSRGMKLEKTVAAILGSYAHKLK